MNEVEAAAGDGAMLFTLPYMKNFENGSLNNMWDYTLLRGPLHSKTLKFTYGAGYGTKNDLWYRETSELEPDAMVAELRTQGMTGIYLDLDGYPEDEQQSALTALTEAAGCGPEDVIHSGKRAALLHPAGAGVTHETAKITQKRWFWPLVCAVSVVFGWWYLSIVTCAPLGGDDELYQPAELLLYYAHLVWPERAGLPWRFVGAVQPAERAVPALLVAAGARPDELVPGDLVGYRLYILAWTYADIVLTAWLVGKASRNKSWALPAFACCR